MIWRQWLPLAILVSSTLWVGAKDFYVSTNGSLAGNGILGSPWSLQKALTNFTVIQPGDTIKLRGGTYSNLFTMDLRGTSNSPIIIRNYNQERAIIDGQLRLIESSNVWIWGLEITDSNKTNRIDPFATCDGGAAGVKWINNLIHDCCIGINSGGNRPAPYEAYGNVLWYCGKSSLEHGLYWQNDGPARKLIQNNLIGYSHGFGIQFYGSSGKANNAHIIQNAIWGSGALWDGKSDIVIGSAGVPSSDQLIQSNSLYNPGGRGLDLGYGQTDTNVVVIDNTIKSASGQWLRNESANYTFTNNLIGSFYGVTILRYFTNFIQGPHVWDYNAYYNTSTSYPGSWSNQFAGASGSTNELFPAWKANTGFDTHSTFFGPEGPTNSVVYVWPNTYEAKRAHVVVWNYGQSNNIPVDLSGVLSPGDTYEVRHAMDYFGAPVVRGIYAGGSVTIPLTNLTVTAPVNDYPVAYPYNANFTTNFAAFVVLGSNTNAVLLPPGRLHVTP